MNENRRAMDPHETSTGTLKRTQCLLLALALALLVFLFFGRTYGYGFIELDDPSYVARNPYVTRGLSPASAVWAFTQIHFGNYHPLTTLSHLLDVSLFGLNAGGHHLTSVLLHALNCVLLFVFLLRATGSMAPAWAVAAIFAIHPLHVEPVVWIASRKDVLSGCFALLALLAYLRYAARPCAARMAVVALCFACGLLSKPAVLPLPLVLLALDFWPLRRLRPEAGARTAAVQLGRLVAEKTPLFALMACAIPMALLAQQHEGALRTWEEFPPAVRAATAVENYARYTVQTFYPGRLAPFYPHPRGLPSWRLLAGAALLAGGATVLAAVAWRRAPYLLAGWAWYFVLFTPVAGWVAVGAHARADRFVYLPLAGLLVCIVWGGFALAERLPRRLRGPVLGLLLGGWAAALGSQTFEYTGAWRGNEPLFLHTLNVTQRNAQAHSSLAVGYLNDGRDREALARFAEAVRMEPGRRDGALLQVGRAWAERESFTALLALLGEVFPGADAAAAVHFHRANALLEAGRTKEAIQGYLDAVALNPAALDAKANLGVAYLADGQPDAAATVLAEVLAVQPDDPEVRLNRAAALFQNGDQKAARAETEEVLRREPGNAAAAGFLSALDAAAK